MIQNRIMVRLPGDLPSKNERNIRRQLDRLYQDASPGFKQKIRNNIKFALLGAGKTEEEAHILSGQLIQAKIGIGIRRRPKDIPTPGLPAPTSKPAPAVTTGKEVLKIGGTRVKVPKGLREGDFFKQRVNGRLITVRVSGGKISAISETQRRRTAPDRSGRQSLLQPNISTPQGPAFAPPPTIRPRRQTDLPANISTPQGPAFAPPPIIERRRGIAKINRQISSSAGFQRALSPTAESQRFESALREAPLGGFVSETSRLLLEEPATQIPFTIIGAGKKAAKGLIPTRIFGTKAARVASRVSQKAPIALGVGVAGVSTFNIATSPLPLSRSIEREAAAISLAGASFKAGTVLGGGIRTATKAGVTTVSRIPIKKISLPKREPIIKIKPDKIIVPTRLTPPKTQIIDSRKLLSETTRPFITGEQITPANILKKFRQEEINRLRTLSGRVSVGIREIDITKAQLSISQKIEAAKRLKIFRERVQLPKARRLALFRLESLARRVPPQPTKIDIDKIQRLLDLRSILQNINAPRLEAKPDFGAARAVRRGGRIIIKDPVTGQTLAEISKKISKKVSKGVSQVTSGGQVLLQQKGGPSSVGDIPKPPKPKPKQIPDELFFTRRRTKTDFEQPTRVRRGRRIITGPTFKPKDATKPVRVPKTPTTPAILPRIRPVPRVVPEVRDKTADIIRQRPIRTVRPRDTTIIRPRIRPRERITGVIEPARPIQPIKIPTFEPVPPPKPPKQPPRQPPPKRRPPSTVDFPEIPKLDKIQRELQKLTKKQRKTFKGQFVPSTEAIAREFRVPTEKIRFIPGLTIRPIPNGRNRRRK